MMYPMSVHIWCLRAWHESTTAPTYVVGLLLPTESPLTADAEGREGGGGGVS